MKTILNAVGCLFRKKAAPQPQPQPQPEQAPSQSRKLNKRGGKRCHGPGAHRINPNAPILDQARQVRG
jgi:hypothetical protein